MKHSIFSNNQILDFINEHDISEDHAIKFLSEFKIFLKNSDEYKLVYSRGTILVQEKQNEVNVGLTYLENSFFDRNIIFSNLDITSNPSKAHIAKIILSNPKKGLFVTGNNGVGKTSMVVAFANNHFDQTGRKTLFVFWPDFIEKTKRFNQNNVAYINKVKYANRLIIDDLGQEAISQWSRDDILNSIIAFRLEKKLYTIITSNFKQSELINLYAFKSIESKKVKSIVNKISAMCPEAVIVGDDLRKKNL